MQSVINLGKFICHSFLIFGLMHYMSADQMAGMVLEAIMVYLQNRLLAGSIAIAIGSRPTSWRVFW